MFEDLNIGDKIFCSLNWWGDVVSVDTDKLVIDFGVNGGYNGIVYRCLASMSISRQILFWNKVDYTPQRRVKYLNPYWNGKFLHSRDCDLKMGRVVGAQKKEVLKC